MKLAKRPDEKKLVLGSLGGVPTPGALKLIVPCLDDPALVEEAGAAAVRIAPKVAETNKDMAREAMTKVLAKAKHEKTRKGAEKILGGLKK